MRALLKVLPILLAACWAVEARADAEVSRRPIEEPEAAGERGVDLVRVRERVPVSERPEPEARTEAPAARTPVGAAADGPDIRGGRRIQVFVIPENSTAAMVAGPAQLAFEAEIARLPGFKAVDLVEALAVPPSPEEQVALAKAREAVETGTRHQVSHRYEEAVDSFRQSLAEFEKAGPGLAAAEYATAHALLGYALILAGEEPAGREQLRTAARLDVAKKVGEQDIGARALRALDVAREQVDAGVKGALSVVTSPPGARVFVGGVYKGASPITVDRLPSGVAHVRIDRPGVVPVVRLVEVQPANDTPLRVKLRPTREALALQNTLIQLPRELDRTPGVPDMATALGRQFQLDFAVVITVSTPSTGKAGLRAAVFDFGREARAADEKTTVPSDRDSVRPALAAWAQEVFDKAEGSRNRAARDPLDRSDGTETWYSTSRPREVEPEPARASSTRSDEGEKRKRGRDPLGRVDGTEDW